MQRRAAGSAGAGPLSCRRLHAGPNPWARRRPPPPAPARAAVKQMLRVVPLFETLDDLKHAETAMRQLFSNPWYAAHIQGKQVGGTAAGGEGGAGGAASGGREGRMAEGRGQQARVARPGERRPPHCWLRHKALLSRHRPAWRPSPANRAAACLPLEL